MTLYDHGKAEFTPLVSCGRALAALAPAVCLLSALASFLRMCDCLVSLSSPRTLDQDQWQREYYLFNAILRIRTFKTYRIWKTFKVWRKFVR